MLILNYIYKIYKTQKRFPSKTTIRIQLQQNNILDLLICIMYISIKKHEKICIYIYMIDSDRRPVSNRCPLLKSASTDVIISNHGPILGYSQIGVLSKLSYL